MIDNYSEEQFKKDVKIYFKDNGDCVNCEFWLDCDNVTCLEGFISKSFKTIKLIQEYAKENKGKKRGKNYD